MIVVLNHLFLYNKNLLQILLNAYLQTFKEAGFIKTALFIALKWRYR